jgi:hypothetical protein
VASLIEKGGQALYFGVLVQPESYSLTVKPCSLP